MPSSSKPPSSRDCSCCFLVNFSAGTVCPIWVAGKVEASYCNDSAQLIKACWRSFSRLLQHSRILLPEESHDVVLAGGRDLVDFAVAVLKATGLRLEGFEFRDAEAPKAGYASARETVFSEGVSENRLHVVPANEGAVDPHKVNVHDVVHELEELDLYPRGLPNKLLHAVQRWHVGLFSTEVTRDVAHDLLRRCKA